MASTYFRLVNFTCGRKAPITNSDPEALDEQVAELEKRKCPMCRLEDGDADEWDVRQLAMGLAGRHPLELELEHLIGQVVSFIVPTQPDPEPTGDRSADIAAAFDKTLASN